MSSSTDSLGPADTVVAALHSFGMDDWQTLASFAEPESLADWRESYLDGNLRLPSLEQLALEHPEAPLHANQQLLDTHFTPTRQRFLAQLEEHLAGVQTAEEVETLTPEELLARFWQARDPVNRMKRLYAAAGLPLPPGASTRATPRRFEILSEELPDPEHAAVTWREVAATEIVSEPDPSTWTLRQQPDGGWRVVLDLQFLYLSRGAVAHIIDDPRLAAYLQRLMESGPDSPAA